MKADLERLYDEVSKAKNTEYRNGYLDALRYVIDWLDERDA